MMPLSVWRRTHIQFGAMPWMRRSSRKRTASILVIFIGPTDAAAARACSVQGKIAGAATALAVFRNCLRVILFTDEHNRKGPGHGGTLGWTASGARRRRRRRSAALLTHG